MPPRDHVPSTRTLHRIRTMFLPKWVTSRKPSRLYILIDPVYCGWEVLVRQGETPQQPRLPACECSPLLNAARISPSPHDVGVCQQIDMRCAPLRHFVRFQCQLPIGAATVISRKAIRWTKQQSSCRLLSQCWRTPCRNFLTSAISFSPRSSSIKFAIVEDF